jgi:Cu/Ag efflux pump CusA
VLAGLVLALGIVIDDAVINVENMVRQLRLRRQANSSESFAHTVREATLEMRGPMLFATTILLLIAMPAFFLSGTIGAFLQPVAIAYGVAIVVSMLVALTVVPALGVMLLPTSPMEGAQSAVVGQLQHGYGSLMSRIVENPRPAFAAACLVALAGLAIFIAMEGRSSIVPTFKERDLLVEIESAPGSSLPAMNELLAKLSKELRAIPGVRSVAGHAGRAVMSDVVKDVNTAQLIVGLERDADHDAIMDDVQQAVGGYAGADIDVKTYLKSCVTDPQRIGNESTEEDIVVRIYGDDWNVLRAKAEEVKNALSGISGIATAKKELPLEQNQIEIQVNLEKAKAHGVKPGDVRRAATTLISGLEVGYLFEQQKVFDVVVWSDPQVRDNLSKIENLLIDAPGGGHVLLKDVAEVRQVPFPTNIKRETVARYVEVAAGVKGRGVAAVAGDVERRLKEIEFPLEYRAELLRSSAERIQARNRAIGAAIAAAIGIYLVVQACVGSWGLATVLFLTLPAAIAGGALVALVGGDGWSMGAILGFIAVLGIAVRNGIGLIKHYQCLAMAPADATGAANSRRRGQLESRARADGASVDGDDAAIFAPGVVQRGTWDRFTPILMTACITALAVLPLVFMGDKPGSEILRPMGQIILGGLVTSTLFSLFAIPAMFLLFTPSRGPELEDLETSLVGEEELHETIAAGTAAEKA